MIAQGADDLGMTALDAVDQEVCVAMARDFDANFLINAGGVGQHVPGERPREREKWPSRTDDHFSGDWRGQEELLAGALLVDEPEDEPDDEPEDELDDAADEPLLDPFVEPPDEPLVDDSDLAGLLAVLVALSEPDERESVR